MTHDLMTRRRLTGLVFLSDSSRFCQIGVWDVCVCVCVGGGLETKVAQAHPIFGIPHKAPFIVLR